jgi:hypothetical protein
MTYEEALERMARAYSEWSAEDGPIDEADREIAKEVAEAIGLREMIESLRNVIDYCHANGAYNFRRLPEEDRDIARIEVWEKIQERIEAALTHRNPNP